MHPNLMNAKTGRKKKERKSWMGRESWSWVRIPSRKESAGKWLPYQGNFKKEQRGSLSLNHHDHCGSGSAPSNPLESLPSGPTSPTQYPHPEPEASKTKQSKNRWIRIQREEQNRNSRAVAFTGICIFSPQKERKKKGTRERERERERERTPSNKCTMKATIEATGSKAYRISN